MDMQQLTGQAEVIGLRITKPGRGNAHWVARIKYRDAGVLRIAQGQGMTNAEALEEALKVAWVQRGLL